MTSGFFSFAGVEGKKGVGEVANLTNGTQESKADDADDDTRWEQVRARNRTVYSNSVSGRCYITFRNSYLRFNSSWWSFESFIFVDYANSHFGRCNANFVIPLTYSLGIYFLIRWLTLWAFVSLFCYSTNSHFVHLIEHVLIRWLLGERWSVPSFFYFPWPDLLHPSPDRSEGVSNASTVLLSATRCSGKMTYFQVRWRMFR